MKITKRLISMLLALTLLVGMYPVTVQAEDVQSTVDSGSTTIEGTNGFGNLLSQDLQEEQAAQEEDYSGGYNVIGLTIEDNIATVEYDSMEEAVLVVALYTEDGVKLLLSGNTLVDPENTVATVELEGDMPEYFMASAYLMDTFDYSPLCSAYDTPMYTKEMQDLLASTTDDYDQDKVLNLDNSKETNFAVFAETTKVLSFVEGVNTVISANDETLTYVIGNADENITSLQVGDVLAYTYGEDQILIVKVATIAIDGTTVTLTGSELEMEEVFSHVKMENIGDAGDVTVDESTAEEGVVYEGLSTDGPQTYGLRAVEGESSLKTYLHFKFLDKPLIDISNPDKSASFSGNVGVAFEVAISYYVSTSRRFIEFQVDVGVKAEVSLSGSITKSLLPLPELSLMFYGISIGFEPNLQFKFSGKIEYSIFAGFTIGFSYENRTGWHDLTTTPKVESEVKLEGSVFFGIDLNPTVEILEGWIAEFELEAPVGLELKASMSGGHSTVAEAKHTCKECIYGELNFKAELTAKMQFLKCSWLALEHKLTAIEIKITDCYFSIDHFEFGWGTCPHQTYRVTVQVKDLDNKNVSNVKVYAQLKEEPSEFLLGETNNKGIVADFLPAGKYTITASINGESFEKEIKVKEACKVILSEADTPKKASIETDKIIDRGVPIRSGTCGVNTYFALYSTGLLEIWGTGSIDYSWDAFYKSIKSVNILHGVTSIGQEAFYDCYNLTSATIPKSVTSIGRSAFYACSKLASINIPNGVTSIGNHAFYSCALPSITFPESITSIGSYAFFNCKKLKTIRFEGNRPNINDYAFIKISSTAYYPAGNSTWTNSTLSNFGGTITWVPYTPDNDGGVWVSLDETENIFATNDEENFEESEGISTYGIWGGEYETEVTNSGILKTATFSGLVPGAEYVLLSLVNTEGEDWVEPENLLYIAQDVASEDGSLVFTYIQRQDTDISYVMACGATYNNLNDAEISFPEMAASEEVHAVEPTVVFDGKTLVEGVDYTIVGTASYTAAGTYTCYIRGIYNYSGTVKCTYTVGSFFGDLDSNSTVDCNDAIYLLLSIMFGEENYPLNGAGGDIDGNGTVNQEDAVYLLLHTLFGEDFYPLVPTKANPLV